MKTLTRDNILYFFCGVAATILFSKMVPTSFNYQRGVFDTMQEAYENGLALKYKTADYCTAFRWIETHKLGYE